MDGLSFPLSTSWRGGQGVRIFGVSSRVPDPRPLTPGPLTPETVIQPTARTPCPGPHRAGAPQGCTASLSLSSALEGDHAPDRALGPHPGPHLPRPETRRVVPRDAGDPRRERAGSEPPPRHGPAHLPSDSPVSPAALVRRPAGPQRRAAAPLVGTELRRVPAVQCAGAPGSTRAQGLVPALQRPIPRRLGRLRVVCVRDVA